MTKTTKQTSKTETLTRAQAVAFIDSYGIARGEAVLVAAGLRGATLTWEEVQRALDAYDRRWGL